MQFTFNARMYKLIEMLQPTKRFVYQKLFLI